MNNNKRIDFSEIKSIPNIITIIRIILIIPFVIKFLEEDYVASIIIISISGLTDILDGVIARKFNQITNLGKLLDPLADKMTLIAVAVCLCVIFPVIIPLLVILLVKDILMLLGGLVLVVKKIAPPAAKWYGKIGTVFFYISVIILIFLKAVYNYENDILTISLMVVTAATMLFALVKYFSIFLDLRAEDKKKEEIEKTKKIEKTQKNK